MEKAKDLFPIKSQICCLPAPQATRNPKHQAATMAQMEAFLNTWRDGQGNMSARERMQGVMEMREKKARHKVNNWPVGCNHPRNHITTLPPFCRLLIH